MNDLSDDERDPLDCLADEFLECLRRGERPSLSLFARRAPGREDEARELLSALVMVEGLKPRANETIGHPGGAVGLAPGLERLGDYRIIREIGRGGMGVVYEAEQVSLGRRVALKILAPGIARTSQQVQRFLREARAAAGLHHTNIVPVFGVGDENGLYYYAMQFIVGQGIDKVLEELKSHPKKCGTDQGGAAPNRDPSLSAVTRLLSDGSSEAGMAPPSGDDPHVAPSSASSSFPELSSTGRKYARGVARAGLQVSHALEYAHQQGTLHRDIKPSNLLLDLKGNVWVADFGLAKVAEDEDLTHTGDIVGTLRYMAPERFRGRCDARSDIHALGLTLYEMMALRPAFEATNRDSLIYQMTHREPPRLRTLRPDVPRDLDTIIHKAIEPDPSHRYQTARAMGEDLRRFLENRPILARRVPFTERFTRWARRNPGVAALGTAVVALVAVIVGVIVAADLRLRGKHALLLISLERAECAERDALAKLLESSLAHASASRRGVVMGRRHAGISAMAEAVRLDIDQKRRREFRDEAIACLALADLKPLAGIEHHAEHGYVGFDFDPNGRRIARGSPSGEITVEEDGRIVARLTGNGLRCLLLRFSSDGRFLAAKHEGEGRSELVVHDLELQKVALRTAEGVHSDAIDFTPDGRSLAAGRRDGSIIFHDLTNNREPRRLAPKTVPRAIRVDPSGRLLAVASSNSDSAVQVRAVDDGRVLAEWTRPEGALAIDWHPDGRHLAAAGEDGRIHLLDLKAPESAPRLLEGHGGSVVELTYHPGGAILASASWDGTLRLWDERTGRELVEAPLDSVRRLRFSRDGSLVGPGFHQGQFSLLRVSDGREYAHLLASHGPSRPIRSIDSFGTTGFLIAAEDAGLRISTGEASGPPALAEMPGTTVAAVAPDGSFLLSSGPSGIFRWPVSTPTEGTIKVGPPEPIGSTKGQPAWRLRLSRDGSTAAAVTDDEKGRILVLDLKGTRPPVEWIGHPNVERLDVSPDGRWVATGTWKGEGVKVWDARQGTLAVELPVSGSADVAFSPDGRTLVTGGSREYRFWQVGTWSPGIRIPRTGAGDLPGEAAFRDDNRMLAVARSRSLIALINPETGEEHASLTPPEPREITGLRFDGNGDLLVLSQNVDAVRRWNLRALRRGLADVGLDWSPPETAEVSTRGNARPTVVVVEQASWLAPFDRGDVHLRSGHWSAAATEYHGAIAAGAPGPEPWSRLALASTAMGDAAGYRSACENIVKEFGASHPAPRLANLVAWSCALREDGLTDYARAVSLAEDAASTGRGINRLNTLGAILYRAGQFERSVAALDRSVALHGAGGTPYDALFLAMAHHKLEHREQAARWLVLATAPAPSAMRKPDVNGPSSWMPPIELEILRREAAALLKTGEN